MSQQSIVYYYGNNVSRCGYCKGTNCSISNGMTALTLTTQDYQALIDRGWRRSGDYCYRPSNKETCCPLYTIKCDALQFKLSKSHKKILKRMNRFLRNGKSQMNKEDEQKQAEQQEADADVALPETADFDIADEPRAPNAKLPAIDLDALQQSAITATQKLTAMETLDRKSNATDNVNVVAVSKKAKRLRMERKIAKFAAKGLEATFARQNSATQEKTLHDYLVENDAEQKHKLKLCLVPVKSAEFEWSEKMEYALYQKYQSLIHNDPPERMSDFVDFLVKTPLQLTPAAQDASISYGSYHQQYWLDDKLIAVGVIDILPYCVSSVYFFYDPDYAFLSLGTYGSLREIDLVQQLAEKLPELKYYYMGFYIHTCPKMRYKAKLQPSQLLCSEVYTWHNITADLLAKLDAEKYQRFNTDPMAKDAQLVLPQHLDAIRIVMPPRIFISFTQFKAICKEKHLQQLLEYAQLVGRVSASCIIYYGDLR